MKANLIRSNFLLRIVENALDQSAHIVRISDGGTGRGLFEPAGDTIFILVHITVIKRSDGRNESGAHVGSKAMDDIGQVDGPPCGLWLYTRMVLTLVNQWGRE